MSSEVEFHIFRVTFLIRKVTMAVKFPCSLIFQLKNGTLFVTKMQILWKVEWPMSSRTEHVNRTRNYLSILKFHPSNHNICKKKYLLYIIQLNLIVLMVSSNGRIPAGSISIKVAEEGKIV